MADLTVLATLKERLGITGSNPNDVPDAYLENLIDRATDIIENQVVGRQLDSQAFTEYYDGTGTRTLFLRQGPTSTLTSVSTVEWSSAGVATATAMNAGDYFLRGTTTEGWKLPSRIESNSSVWTRGQQNYKVVYTAGYSTIPEDIEEAALYACVFMKNTRKDAATGARTIGDGSMSFDRTIQDLIRDLKTMLHAYIPVY